MNRSEKSWTLLIEMLKTYYNNNNIDSIASNMRTKLKDYVTSLTSMRNPDFDIKKKYLKKNNTKLNEYFKYKYQKYKKKYASLCNINY
jgi:hypothetical protein